MSLPEAFYDYSKMYPCDLNGSLVSETKMNGVINNYPVRRAAVPYFSIDMYLSDDRTFRVFVKTPDLNIVDLTGATGVMTVKTSKGGSVIISKSTAVPSEGQIGAADEGEMFFFFVPADTSSLDARQYVFDVSVTLSNGKKYTILDGVMNLIQPVS